MFTTLGVHGAALNGAALHAALSRNYILDISLMKTNIKFINF